MRVVGAGPRVVGAQSSEIGRPRTYMTAPVSTGYSTSTSPVVAGSST